MKPPTQKIVKTAWVIAIVQLSITFVKDYFHTIQGFAILFHTSDSSSLEFVRYTNFVIIIIIIIPMIIFQTFQGLENFQNIFQTFPGSVRTLCRCRYYRPRNRRRRYFWRVNKGVVAFDIANDVFAVSDVITGIFIVSDIVIGVVVTDVVNGVGVVAVIVTGGVDVSHVMTSIVVVFDVVDR